MKMWEAVPVVVGARTDAWTAETEFKEPPVIFTRGEIAAIGKALVASDEVEKYVINIHDEDARGDGTDKYDHAHIPTLFKNDVPPERLQQIIFEATGKTIGIQYISKSTLNKNPATRSQSPEIKFAVAAMYALHENKDGSGRADLNQDTPYKSVKGTEWTWDGKTFLYPDVRATWGNTNYSAEYQTAAKFYQWWSKKKADEEQKAADAELIQRIGSGEIREYDIVNQCDVNTYVRLKRDIDNALEYAYARASLEAKMKNLVRNAIYIQGSSGDGKTVLAIKLCEKLGLSYYITSSGKHLFDGYKGEDVIIFDDFRSRQVEFSELLKMLNNNSTCDIEARYHNKSLAFCKMFIFTSTQYFKDLYKHKFEKDAALANIDRKRIGEETITEDGILEERDQLNRRVKFIIDVTVKDKAAMIYRYDKKSKKHVPHIACDWTFDVQEYIKSLPEPEGLTADEILAGFWKTGSLKPKENWEQMELELKVPENLEEIEIPSDFVEITEETLDERSEASPDDAPAETEPSEQQPSEPASASTEPSEQQPTEPTEPALQSSDWVASPLASDDGFEEFDPDED